MADAVAFCVACGKGEFAQALSSVFIQRRTLYEHRDTAAKTRRQQMARV